MIDENMLIEVRWNSKNREYYESKGYNFSKLGSLFYVRILDLLENLSVYVPAKCDYCGKDMEIRYSDYVKKIKTYGVNYCKQCMHKHTLDDRRNNIFDKIRNKCSELGYNLLSSIEQIDSYKSYVQYECPKHGIKSVRVGNLISGKICPDCASENRRNIFKLSKSDIIKQVKLCGGNLLNPDDYINNTTKNLQITCPECGDPFITSLRNFTQHGGQLCEKCHRIRSVGESKIANYLRDRNILFEREKWFSDCRAINPLPFDFYLQDYNCMIEFDGIHHFAPIYGEDMFLTIQYHDWTKNEYCRTHNIKLIRVPYWEIDNITKILDLKL